MTPLEEAVKRVEAFLRDMNSQRTNLSWLYQLDVPDGVTRKELATDLRLLLSAVEGGGWRPDEISLFLAGIDHVADDGRVWICNVHAFGEAQVGEIRAGSLRAALRSPLPPAPAGEGTDHSSVARSPSGSLASRVAETNREPETGESA